MGGSFGVWKGYKDMKLAEVLISDARIEENRDEVQRWLRKIKPFANYSEGEEVPLEKLEQFIWKFSKLYNIVPRYVTFSNSNKEYDDEKDVFRLNFTKADATHEWLVCVIGLTLYETFAKGVLAMYAYIKSHEEARR